MLPLRGQSGPGRNGDERLLHLLQSPRTGAWRLFSVISGTLVGGGVLTSLQRCSRYFLQPKPTGSVQLQTVSKEKFQKDFDQWKTNRNNFVLNDKGTILKKISVTFNPPFLC